MQVNYFFQTNSSKGFSMSSSVKSWSGKLCGCDGRMVSYQCKKGKNKGRLFWRCPFWRSDETCNLFIWDEDMRSKGGNEDGSIMKSELEAMEVMGYLKVMYEDLKKNKNLKNKLKSEKFSWKFEDVMFYYLFNV